MTTDGKRVLIVDDDDDIRANIQDILSDLGYRTDTAHDGVSAIHLVEEHPYDVVLLDYQMPGLDGASLYQKIKKIRPEAVAIMVTAYAGSHGVQQACEAGTWHVLRKPVDLDRLLPLVAEASQSPIVLVVDDDEDFCQNLWHLLRDKGYRVSLAHSEREGIQKAGDNSFEVAIVDLRLGNGDGRKVIENVRRANPQARVVIVTGLRDEAVGIGDQVEDQTVDGVCYKPIQVDQLLQMIDRSAAGSR